MYKVYSSIKEPVDQQHHNGNMSNGSNDKNNLFLIEYTFTIFRDGGTIQPSQIN